MVTLFVCVCVCVHVHVHVFWVGVLVVKLGLPEYYLGMR